MLEEGFLLTLPEKTLCFISKRPNGLLLGVLSTSVVLLLGRGKEVETSKSRQGQVTLTVSRQPQICDPEMPVLPFDCFELIQRFLCWASLPLFCSEGVGQVA